MTTLDMQQSNIMNRTIRFWDKLADRYSRKPVPDEAVYQKKLQITREYLRPDMDVLEIGCGTGSTAIAHAPYVKHIRATDISPRMLEIAKSKAMSDNIDDVTFEQLEIDQMQLTEQSVDAVLGLSILHLLEDKEKAIANIYKSLKPGGVFVTSTACIGDMSALLKYFLPITHFLRLTPFVSVFSKDEFRKSLTDAGFRIEHEWLPGKKQSVFIVASKV